MRTAQFVLSLLAMALPVAAQQPAPVTRDSAPAPSTAASPAAQKLLQEDALKFVQASDARPRLEQSLDKLLEEGKEAMMQRNPGLNPKFGDEWVKRMRERVKPDDFVNITAKVYASYYTSAELQQMTQAQLALKNSRNYPLAPELSQKIKANAPRIQNDINTDISKLGSSLSIEVGKQIERDHPDWARALPPDPAPRPPANK